jgi:mono/diheme cytochrome c family protein
MKPDKTCLSLALLIILAVFSWFTSCTHVANIANIPEVCFTADVLPIFVNNCAMPGCHDGGGRESRMALNNYADIIRTVTAGNPNASRSYQVIIAKSGENMMPPGQPLTLTNRTLIRIWIEQGAGETTCPGSPAGGGGTYVARACFSRDILPVILSRCATTGCHDANAGSELSSFTTYANIKRSVSPGNPSQSRLYTVINLSSGESKMPPANRPQLTVAEIDSIGKWISYGALNETCGEVCDTINPVTFSGTIWPIMQTSCTGCHTGSAPGGGITLANYANVQTVAANGSLMNSLRGNGVSLMPKGSSFSACRIRQFDMWVKNGALNN